MTPDLAALALIFNLCNAAVCKIETVEAPCKYQVITYHDVKVGDWAWTGTMADKFVMIPKGRLTVDICEVTKDERSSSDVPDGTFELQQSGAGRDVCSDELYCNQGVQLYWKSND